MFTSVDNLQQVVRFYVCIYSSLNSFTHAENGLDIAYWLNFYKFRQWIRKLRKINEVLRELVEKRRIAKVDILRLILTFVVCIIQKSGVILPGIGQQIL